MVWQAVEKLAEETASETGGRLFQKEKETDPK
jgi:hypothetical protein